MYICLIKFESSFMTSKIHYFNPGHELAVLNNTPSYTASKSIRTIISQLSGLPMWYAGENEYVLAQHQIDKDYYTYLRELGFKLPTPLLETEIFKVKEDLSLQMWGLAPDALQMFKRINTNYAVDVQLPNWSDDYIYYASRKFSIDVLNALIEASPENTDYLETPMLFESVSVFEQFLKEKASRFVVKAPYSSSGKGLLWVQHNLSRSEKQILQGILNKQSYFIVEYAYNKVLDFACEYLIKNNESITFEGISLFETSTKGWYNGNILISQNQILNKIASYVDLKELDLFKVLLSKIISRYIKSGYCGVFGVDMMIVENEGKYYIHPCVEVNFRYNMGYLAIRFFDSYVSPFSNGNYYFDYLPSSELQSKHQELILSYPLIVNDGRIVSGYLSLCPVTDDSTYLAYVIIKTN